MRIYVLQSARAARGARRLAALVGRGRDALERAREDEMARRLREARKLALRTGAGRFIGDSGCFEWRIFVLHAHIDGWEDGRMDG